MCFSEADAKANGAGPDGLVDPKLVAGKVLICEDGWNDHGADYATIDVASPLADSYGTANTVVSSVDGQTARPRIRSHWIRVYPENDSL